ncbi:dolichyl-phosphate-mannose-protein mannosyltransferase [Pancytospora philotis]|nr:dolichyl-phosphate-mannose-protein mannosyltransferase [Pancytospora philotis]
MQIRRYMPQLAVFVLSYLVKEYKIEKGNFVIWDEAHFGKFSQAYLDRAFFFDVHPPLGKMLTALSGWLYGQSSSFLFSSAEEFPASFDYVGMRRCHAFIASFVPLFGYLSLRQFGCSARRSLLGASLLIFENGMSSIGRLILLDAHLLAFTAAITYYLLCLHNCNAAPQNGRNKHSRMAVLLKLGTAIGCAISVKWIGCLAMLFVGMYVIYDLFDRLLHRPLGALLRDFAEYALTLLLLPAAIYTGLFWLHFAIARQSGADDGFMSTRFQLGLENSAFAQSRTHVSFGKQVTVRTGRGYLHSHEHEYPDGKSADEVTRLQTTLYGAKDSNNNFYIQRVTDSLDTGFLQAGDKVVLHHSETKGYLELDGRAAYVSDGLRVVNSRKSPSLESVWEVRSKDGRPGPISAIEDEFYLWSVKYGGYLTASDESYPSWGHGQGEVYCSTERMPGSSWQIEENLWSEETGNPLYKQKGGRMARFLRGLVELNKTMYSVNKGFKQNTDLEPERIVSSPWEWLVLRRGLRMSQWGDKHKFYMFMNPLVLYSSTAAVLLAPAFFLCSLIKGKRRESRRQARIILRRTVAKAVAQTGSPRCPPRVYEESGQKTSVVVTKTVSRNKQSHNAFCFYVVFCGWLVHYFAFFSVGRVLYLHHYFPALFFAVLGISYTTRALAFRWMAVYAAVAVAFYCLYAPLTYGFMHNSEVAHLKLVPSWDFLTD